MYPFGSSSSLILTLSLEDRAFWQSFARGNQHKLHVTHCELLQPVDIVLLAYVSYSCRQTHTCTVDNRIFSLELKLCLTGEKSPKHPFCYVYIFHRDISLWWRDQTKLNYSHDVALFMGMMSECSKFTHILYSSSGVSLLSLILSVLQTNLTGCLYQSDHLYTPGTGSTSI